MQSLMQRPQVPETTTKKTGAMGSRHVNVPDVSSILAKLAEAKSAMTPVMPVGDDAMFNLWMKNMQDLEARGYSEDLFHNPLTGRQGTSRTLEKSWRSYPHKIEYAQVTKARTISEYVEEYQKAKESQRRTGGEWAWCCWCGNWDCSDSPRYWCKKS